VSQITSMQPIRSADCEPTLTDSQVLEFCRKDYLYYEAVVPDEINERAFNFIAEHGQNPLRQEDWFVQNVFLNLPSQAPSDRYWVLASPSRSVCRRDRPQGSGVSVASGV